MSRIGVEGKDSELNVKVEEILTLMKGVIRGWKGKDELKARNDENSEVYGVYHPSEPERMLKECI